MSLNTHSPIPLYQQLADRIRYEIETGGYRVNDKIPSEHVLAKQYAIGRPTVRQATDLLVRKGILQRKRGSGTFVLPPTQRIDLFSLTGTSAAF
ncbi:MAG: GntR family transcriptional regulator, partial [Shimia sp.]|nr:GntR family transcriptional regulator [Shimia sp.]